ncbi:AraC family transcriptional regulator [Sphingomonas soli]|uniref:AraC family transcriptional regulator n=1 Tax=Sphingomonas soli TaxID=266127 RepID=UPI00082F44EE|nr:GyrI-like domain-containing protein [Sphingomonas soli]
MTDIINHWVPRLERALALLTDRIDAPPSLEELAGAAAISPYHFHRIWRVMTGETLGDTIARLRIAAAQQRLRDGTGNVTEVAMEGGYATPQSFARAFRRLTGTSPSEFLASGLATLGTAPPKDADIRIELREPCKLVALRRVGGDYVELNALYWQLFEWAGERGYIEQLEGIYGILLDDPLSVEAPALRYDAAIAIGDVTVEEPFHPVILPSGDHACLRAYGSHDRLEDANQRLIAFVLASGREPADAPLYHHALNDPDEVPEEALETDILIALQPA